MIINQEKAKNPNFLAYNWLNPSHPNFQTLGQADEYLPEDEEYGASSVRQVNHEFL
jgi:hypothetical protein